MHECKGTGTRAWKLKERTAEVEGFSRNKILDERWNEVEEGIKKGRVPYSTVQYSGANYRTGQCSAEQYSTAQPRTEQPTALQYSREEYSTVSTVRYNIILDNTAQHCTAQCS